MCNNKSSGPKKRHQAHTRTSKLERKNGYGVKYKVFAHTRTHIQMTNRINQIEMQTCVCCYFDFGKDGMRTCACFRFRLTNIYGKRHKQLISILLPRVRVAVHGTLSASVRVHLQAYSISQFLRAHFHPFLYPFLSICI